MKKRYLFILSLFFIGIYGLTQFSTQISANEFSTHLFQLDTAEVQQIIINTNIENIQFYRVPKGWQVSTSGITTQALTETVNDLLMELNKVETARVAAKQAVEWDNYGVGEAALQIEIISTDQKSERLLVGGLTNRESTQPDTTFARLPAENEVYALVDFKRQLFARLFGHYRERRLIQLSDNQMINQIVVKNVDSLYLQKKVWKSRLGTELDSAQVANYLKQLKYVEATQFADDFDETLTTILPKQQLIIRGDNITPDIQITAYQDSTATLPFIIHSSQFAANFYASDSSGVYQQLFGWLMKERD